MEVDMETVGVESVPLIVICTQIYFTGGKPVYCFMKAPETQKTVVEAALSDM